MNGILIKQNGCVSHVEFNKENVVETLRKLVGGYIECVFLSNELVMVVDEEGKLKRKDLNEIATRIILQNTKIMDCIVGDVVICHVSLLD